MKNLLLIFLLLSSLTSMAKTNRLVSGTVLDQKGEALAFANVLLFKAQDSSLYKATAADAEGKFSFEDLQDNRYFIKVSFVGYQEFLSPHFELTPEKPTHHFERIEVQENQNLLNEVQVVAKKPFIEQQIDKTVLNVENSISGSGSTALEVLEKAPGVIVDRQNDQIKIRNKAGVVVMIDGKINYMSGETLAQYLNNLPSDQIQSIEIITNPSSKYDASGNAGIINIKLKKNKNYGTNGNVSITASEGLMKDTDPDMVRGNTSLNINHRNAKWNIFGNGATGRSRFYNDNNIIRNVNFNETISHFDQFTYRIGGGQYYNGKLGADYSLSNKTTIGFQGDFNQWNGKINSDGLTQMTESKSPVFMNLYAKNTSNITEQNYSGNLNLRHKFNEEGKELSIDLDYSGYNNTNKQSFENKYTGSQFPVDSVLLQNMSQPTHINIYSGKIDYTLPTASKVKYEFGAKASKVITDNNFVFNNWVNDSHWEVDQRKTNHFKYNEAVYAAYANAGYQGKKWGVQAGLRLEHTYSDGHSLTTNERNTRNYTNLFPTVFVSQTINDNNAIRYSFSRRIDRPNYSQLNPFLFFLDPLTYLVGNPFLQPQFTNSYEVTYTLKDTYSAGVSFADTDQMIFEVLLQNDETKETYQTNHNLKGVQNYAINLSAPFQINKWWNMQNNANIFYAHYKDDNVSGASLNAGQAGLYFFTNNTFMMPKKWSSEVSLWYQSPNRYGIIEITTPNWALNFGIQKSFTNSKLKLNVNDVFATSKMSGRINYANMDVQLNNRWTSRRVSLTFTYNFGNQNVRVNKRSTGADELKQRAGGNNN